MASLDRSRSRYDVILCSCAAPRVARIRMLRRAAERILLRGRSARTLRRQHRSQQGLDRSHRKDTDPVPGSSLHHHLGPTAGLDCPYAAQRHCQGSRGNPVPVPHGCHRTTEANTKGRGRSRRGIGEIWHEFEILLARCGNHLCASRQRR